MSFDHSTLFMSRQSSFILEPFDPWKADYESDEPPLPTRDRREEAANEQEETDERTVYFWRNGKLVEKDLSRNKRGEKHGSRHRRRQPSPSRLPPSLEESITGKHADREQDIAAINKNILSGRRSESRVLRPFYWSTHERPSSKITDSTAHFSDAAGNSYTVGKKVDNNGTATTYKLYFRSNRGGRALTARRGDRLVLILTYISLKLLDLDDPSVALSVGVVVYSNETARAGIDASGTLVVTPDSNAQYIFQALSEKE
jgi:hypothetical protein